MGNTKIEYLDATWNFLTGCNNWKDPSICGGGGSDFTCWAKGMAERFGNGFEPRLIPDKVNQYLPRVPARIGVCFTGDLFQDDTIPNMESGVFEWPLRVAVFNKIRVHPQHQFFFLTKCPWHIKKWGRFPDNAWVGVSVTKSSQLAPLCTELEHVDAAHKWLSIEPLISWDLPSKQISDWFNIADIDWIVIGGLSNKLSSQQPNLEWVKEIVMAADSSGIPVFLKNNLSPVDKEGELFFSYWPGFLRQTKPGGCWGLRQELPTIKQEAVV